MFADGTATAVAVTLARTRRNGRMHKRKPSGPRDWAGKTMTTPFSVLLSGELGLRGIEALGAELTAALAGHDEVVIDATTVESADTSTIQLLLSAQKSANADGKALSLTAAPSGPLATTLVVLGLLRADGTPLVPETSTWTITKAAA